MGLSLPVSEVFLDTAYAIALSTKTDAFHSQALQLAEQMETQKVRMVTTQAILLEIGSALSRLNYRSAAVSLLSALEQDPQVE
jgi:hypothetical protein